ncbi:MAG: polysaccharide deacetylase family protein [Terriglobales bacterium]
MLYYHSVPPAERELFARQLDMLLRHARPLRSDEELNCLPVGDSVAITFDDGFENFLTQALPELEKRRIPSTVFLIAEGMNREFGSAESSEKLLSLEQVQSLPRRLVSLGSHTLSHPLLTEIEEAVARREIYESRVKLESILDRPVTEFSFPFGGFNQKLVAAARDAGYRRVYTTLPAFAFEDGNDFVIGRVRVDPTDWPMEFRLKLSGAYRWLPIVFSAKRWAIEAARRIWQKPVAQSTTPRSMVR